MSIEKTRLGVSGFLRLPEVLKIVPISKSAWYMGIKTGKYPQPIHLGERSVAWSWREIAELIERLEARR